MIFASDIGNSDETPWFSCWAVLRTAGASGQPPFNIAPIHDKEPFLHHKSNPNGRDSVLIGDTA